jgi:hypothetical protein
LYVRLEEERAVAKTEEVRPLQDRFVILDPNCRIDAVRQPLGAPQITAKLTVDDSKARNVPWPRCADAAGQDASGEEKGELTSAVVWRGLHAGGYAQPTQDFLPRIAKPDQSLIEQTVEAIVAMFDMRRNSQVADPSTLVAKSGNALPSYQMPAL